MLTDSKVRAAKPRVKPYKLTDEKGLHLLVHPNGGKYWQFRYRFSGKENTESFGTYPEVSLMEARDRRDETRRSLRSGENPSAAKKLARQNQLRNSQGTFERVAREWLEVWKVGKDPETVAYKTRRIESDLLPRLAGRPIADISRREVIDVIRAIASRGVGETARRALQVTKAIMSFAVTHEYRDANPVADLKPFQIIGVPRSKHFAHIDEKRLPTLLAKIDLYEGLVTKFAMKLMCQTFVRTGTLRRAKWVEIDFERRQWNIPAEHMKKVSGVQRPHIVPLSSQSIRLLKQLKKITGRGVYLFPGDSKEIMSENTILRALERMGFKGEMTGHGFRSLASTVLHERGFDHMHIERQLAHQERNESSAPYNHAEFLAQRKKMMQAWSDYLEMCVEQA